MSDPVVIVSAARTPVGAFQGDLSSLSAHDLGGVAIRAAVERAGIAPESVAEFEQIAAALPDVTLVANMVETGKSPLLTPAELADLGFRFVISPLSVLFSMVKAATNALATLQSEGSLRNHLPTLIDFAEFGRLVDLEAHCVAEEQFRS